MKKRLKKGLINILIVLIILIIAYFVIRKPFQSADEKTTLCIAKNSLLYTQYGCHACENQKKLFGENYEKLNVIDCWFEQEKCTNITATPTWIIKDKTITGVQSIENLKELTGCA